LRAGSRDAGIPTKEPCDRCGCDVYERDGEDLLCGECGLPYGESQDEDVQ